MENIILNAFEPIIQYVLSNAKDVEIMIIMTLFFTILLILQKCRYENLIDKLKYEHKDNLTYLHNILDDYETFFNSIEKDVEKYKTQIPLIEQAVKNLIDKKNQLKATLQEKDFLIKYLKKNK